MKHDADYAEAGEDYYEQRDARNHDEDSHEGGKAGPAAHLLRLSSAARCPS